MSEQPITTAQAVGRLYAELREQGLPSDLVSEIVLDAARTRIHEGPIVLQEQRPALKTWGGVAL